MVIKYDHNPYHMMTVLLEYIDLLLLISISALILLLMYFTYFLIMLALCLMPSLTHYAQSYAGIIGGSQCVCHSPEGCISQYLYNLS